MKLTSTLFVAVLLTILLVNPIESHAENDVSQISHNYQRPKHDFSSSKKILESLGKNGLDSGLKIKVRINCKERGYFKDPVNPTCKTFILCDITETGDLYGYTLTCPNSWLYNPQKGFCTPFYKCN